MISAFYSTPGGYAIVAAGPVAFPAVIFKL